MSGQSSWHPGTFWISHQKVYATSGGVSSVPAARASAQPCILLGEQVTATPGGGPDCKEGTCWGTPGHCPRTVLLSALTWAVRGTGQLRQAWEDPKRPSGQPPASKRAAFKSSSKGCNKQSNSLSGRCMLSGRHFEREIKLGETICDSEKQV